MLSASPKNPSYRHRELQEAAFHGAEKVLADPASFRAHVCEALESVNNPHPAWNFGSDGDTGLSVVLFLIGIFRHAPECPPEPCLVLNKRSARVPQPGDLCCPGGGIEPRLDRIAAHLLRIPLVPLTQWPLYRTWRIAAPHRAARLRLLMATALREGLEEMRLNPFKVRFLGGLPPEHLVMFKRTIIPLVAWVHRQKRFRPNWEVERIVKIPLRALLTSDKYIALHLQMGEHDAVGEEADTRYFPAFRFLSESGNEVLWGATYRIAMQFLKDVFGFQPPELVGRDTIEKRLTADYLTGKG